MDLRVGLDLQADVDHGHSGVVVATGWGLVVQRRWFPQRGCPSARPIVTLSSAAVTAAERAIAAMGEPG
jgi:hypothetical protein